LTREATIRKSLIVQTGGDREDSPDPAGEHPGVEVKRVPECQLLQFCHHPTWDWCSGPWEYPRCGPGDLPDIRVSESPSSQRRRIVASTISLGAFRRDITGFAISRNVAKYSELKLRTPTPALHQNPCRGKHSTTSHHALLCIGFARWSFNTRLTGSSLRLCATGGWSCLVPALVVVMLCKVSEYHQLGEIFHRPAPVTLFTANEFRSFRYIWGPIPPDDQPGGGSLTRAW